MPYRLPQVGLEFRQLSGQLCTGFGQQSPMSQGRTILMANFIFEASIVDPNSTLNMDPDPGFWSNLDPDPNPHP